LRWDKVRAGGPKRVVHEVAAKLINEPFAEGREELVEGRPKAAWEYEAFGLTKLDDIKDRLQAGELINQKEIADLYVVSKTTAKNWIEKGIRVGLWTKEQVSYWFAKGKRFRTQGNTEAPLRPSLDWEQEDLEDQLDTTGEIPF